MLHLLNHFFSSRRPGWSAAVGTMWLGLGPFAGRAQTPSPAPVPLASRPLFGSYRYTAYTVFDAESPNAPTAVRGVGGTLTLRPDGTYAKRLSITLGSRTIPFTQDGTYLLAGDSIRFAFRDQKGADVQRGTARLDSASRHLTLTILGYPAGNKGVYELDAGLADATVPPVAPAAPRTTPRKKRRH